MTTNIASEIEQYTKRKVYDVAYERGRRDEREEKEELFKSVNIVDLVAKMKEDAEEYGQYHDDECPLMREEGGDFGDVCECEKISAFKSFAEAWMGEVNRMWVVNLKNHRKHCTQDGNKDLTRTKSKLLDTPSEEGNGK